MIADLKPYPDYRDSGLPWLGKVPGHWETRRLKSGVVNVNDQASGLEDGEVYIALEHVSSWTGRTRPQTVTRLFTGNVKRFRRGDVLFGKLRPYLAKVASAEVPGGCAGEFFVLRTTDPDKLSPGYLERLLRAKSMIEVINSSTFGAKMPRADWQFCGNLVLPLPPPPEQAAIVRFLTWANGRLERAIRAKRKVIALLNEQKQAIIHRAVTRGLDPSVPLKPSGIPWLGEIPAHWEVRSFARLARVIRGASPRPAGDPRFFHGDCLPWLTVGEITKDNEVFLTRTETALTRLGVERSVRMPAGTLVMSNSGATLGVPKILSIDCCANDGVVAFSSLSSAVRPEFAYFYLASQTARLRDELRQGGTQPNLNTMIVRSLPCPLPPIGEQLEILEYLGDELSALSTVTGRLSREIDLLHEYRTRLVSDVVTGKLDVRGVAAGLPEEVLEEEAAESLELEAEDEEAVG